MITRNPDRSRDIPRFGPYPDAGNLRSLVAFLMELYPLRRCSTANLKPRKRPCLMGQMDRCPSPCSREQREDYMERTGKILYILRGHWEEARREILERMKSASRALEYEKAAELRDLLKRLDSFGWPAPESLRDRIPRDVMAVSENWGIIIQVRSGRFMGSLRLPFSSKWKLATEGERIAVLLRSYYSETGDIPRQVLLSEQPEDRELLAEWLREMKGGPVEIMVPERGDLRSLVEVAERDLRNFLSKLEWKHPQGGRKGWRLLWRPSPTYFHSRTRRSGWCASTPQPYRDMPRWLHWSALEREGRTRTVTAGSPCPTRYPGTTRE